jgi:hypothetical protein
MTSYQFIFVFFFNFNIVHSRIGYNIGFKCVSHGHRQRFPLVTKFKTNYNLEFTTTLRISWMETSCKSQMYYVATKLRLMHRNLQQRSSAFIVPIIWKLTMTCLPYSTETTKSMDLVKRKTRTRGTRPQYRLPVCPAGAQPRHGKLNWACSQHQHT